MRLLTRGGGGGAVYDHRRWSAGLEGVGVMELVVTVGERDGWVVLVVVGEVDVYSAPRLREAFTQAAGDAPVRGVVVDLSGVTFMDSSGIGSLVSGRRRLAEGAGMRLVCAQPTVVRLFELTGLTAVFPLFATVAEAIG